MIANDRSCCLAEVNDVCVSVITIDSEYFMSFIQYETEDVLGIQYTTTDGTERFIALNKAHIISVGVVYQQDYDTIFEEDNSKNDIDIMYQ